MAANYIESKIIDPTVAPELAVADKVAARHAKHGITPKYFIQTFGCQQNEADSERLAGLCETMGYTRARTPQEALLILVNTCAIREHAEMKALSMIGGFKAIKRKNPELVVGICGCMAAEEHIAKRLKEDFHFVSFTVEPNMLHKIPSLVYRALTEGKRSFVFRKGSLLYQFGKQLLFPVCHRL